MKQSYKIFQSDVIEWAKNYTGEPFHALFADPPYHLTSIHKRFGKPGSAPAKAGVYNRGSKGFMGTDWDGTGESGNGIAFNPETWAALSQHLYPGGFILAFAGTRGYHRMACAMEDSGVIIHPALGWVFLSGFCKATRIDTQVDKAAGVEQEVIGPNRWEGTNGKANKNTYGAAVRSMETAPATPLAQTWAGHRYGLQALKPAFEFIAVAQVPYEDRPVDCITGTGAGAWNIDGGRIPTGNGDDYGRSPNRADGTRSRERGYSWGEGLAEDEGTANDLGRWPANLLLDESGAALLDHQSGERPAGGNVDVNHSPKTNNIYGKFDSTQTWQSYNDSGGASRMFFQSTWQYEILEQLENADPLKYEPKVSVTEGNAGVEDFYWAITPKGFERVTYEEWQSLDPKKRAEGNIHPTKKPIALAKYLATLLLPPAAYAPRRILCPFAGTGSEMIGAILAGWEEVTGIEKTPAYIPIAEKRLAWWSQWPGWGQADVDKILASLSTEQDGRQLNLFEQSATNGN